MVLLKDGTMGDVYVMSMAFTFQYGSIKGKQIWTSKYGKRRFTFQYGSIKGLKYIW